MGTNEIGGCGASLVAAAELSQRDDPFGGALFGERARREGASVVVEECQGACRVARVQSRNRVLNEARLGFQRRRSERRGRWVAAERIARRHGGGRRASGFGGGVTPEHFVGGCPRGR